MNIFKKVLNKKILAGCMTIAACACVTSCEKDDDMRAPDMHDNMAVSIIGHSRDVVSKVRYIDEFQDRFHGQKSGHVNSNTNLVIINGNEGIRQAMENQLPEIKEAYNRGSQIMVVAPDEPELEKFLTEMDHTLSVKSIDIGSEKSGDFCDAYIFNNQNASMVIKDLESSEDCSFVTNRLENIPQTDADGNPIKDADGNPVFVTKNLNDTVFEKVQKTLSHEQKQRVLNNIDKFLASSVESKQLKASGENIADGQHVYLQRTASYNNDGYTATQLVEENYTITAVYSYNEDRDFYMVEQEINTINSQLDYKREVVRKYDGDNWLVSVNFAHGVIPKATLNLKDNNIVHLSQASPNTTTGSSSFTSGVSYNIAGNVGFSMTGPTGGLTGGVTISNTHTTSIPDVMVTKKTIDDGGGAAANNGFVCWDYEIALPRVHSDYTDTHHCRMAIDDVVQIAKGTGTYYNSWIWVIDNPKAHNNGQYGMTAYTISRTGLVRGRQNWVGTQYTSESESWSPATNYITFTQPHRN